MWAGDSERALNPTGGRVNPGMGWRLIAVNDGEQLLRSVFSSYFSEAVPDVVNKLKHA